MNDPVSVPRLKKTRRLPLPSTRHLKARPVRTMVSSIVRASLLALIAAWAAESFVVTVQAPPSALPRQRQQGRTSPKSVARSDVALAPLPMASYDGSSESYGGGELGGSTEMELQELIVDFTDDGRVLLEVKGVKVSFLAASINASCFRGRGTLMFCSEILYLEPIEYFTTRSREKQYIMMHM